MGSGLPGEDLGTDPPDGLWGFVDSYHVDPFDEGRPRTAIKKHRRKAPSAEPALRAEAMAPPAIPASGGLALPLMAGVEAAAGPGPSVKKHLRKAAGAQAHDPAEPSMLLPVGAASAPPAAEPQAEVTPPAIEVAPSAPGPQYLTLWSETDGWPDVESIAPIDVVVADAPATLPRTRRRQKRRRSSSSTQSGPTTAARLTTERPADAPGDLPAAGVETESVSRSRHRRQRRSRHDRQPSHRTAALLAAAAVVLAVAGAAAELSRGHARATSFQANVVPGVPATGAAAPGSTPAPAPVPQPDSPTTTLPSATGSLAALAAIPPVAQPLTSARRTATPAPNPQPPPTSPTSLPPPQQVFAGTPTYFVPPPPTGYTPFVPPPATTTPPTNPPPPVTTPPTNPPPPATTPPTNPPPPATTTPPTNPPPPATTIPPPVATTAPQVSDTTVPTPAPY